MTDESLSDPQPNLKLVSTASEQDQNPIAGISDIWTAVQILHDLERYARNNGHLEIAREIEVASLRIKFLLNSERT